MNTPEFDITLDHTKVKNAKVIFGKAYKATVTGDMDNQSRVFGYYTEYSIAQESVKGKSQWGSDGSVSGPIDIVTIICEDNQVMVFEQSKSIKCYSETEQDRKERLGKVKEELMSKLTEEEKEALGL